MIALIKIILAHFIGDFVLQPKSWVADKELKKAKSSKLYFHALIHGFLIMLLLWDWSYWLLALLLTITHGVIDIVKIYSQPQTRKTNWFLADQGLHLAAILILWVIWFNPSIDIRYWLEAPGLWIYSTALLFITVVSGVIIREVLSGWTKALVGIDSESLNNAGKYIGVLERLFIFAFVVTGNWEAIGFLIAAKSVFRFGDLKESKSRKLTEYFLIGTLLSFGIAIATGMLVLKLTESA